MIILTSCWLFVLRFAINTMETSISILSQATSIHIAQYEQSQTCLYNMYSVWYPWLKKELST